MIMKIQFIILACMKNDISVLSMITSGGNFDVDSIRERLERIRRNN